MAVYRMTTFAIAKLVEQLTKWGAMEKSRMDILKATKIILNFGCTHIIFADYTNQNINLYT